MGELLEKYLLVGMIEIFIHFLLVEHLDVHKDCVVYLLYHEGVGSLRPRNQPQQNLIEVDHVETSCIGWGPGKEASLSHARNELLQGSHHR